MSRFRKAKPRKVPMLNTAALPDLIFTLLFFFLIVTQMRPVPILAKFEIPNAEELQRLEKESRLIYLMVGEKTEENIQPAIQLNSLFVSLNELQENLWKLKEEAPLEEQNRIVVILRIDKNTEMGLVNDIRHILRNTGLLTVYYSAEKTIKKNDF